MEEKKKQNSMAKAKLVKIILTVGVKEALDDKKMLESVATHLAQISGQKPKETRAKKSIATFKLRAGDPIGVMATLRGKKMRDFFQKLVSVVLPRVRDFHGVSVKGFDTMGNYTIGFQEIIVFPEIDPSKTEKMKGLQVTIVTTAKSSEEGKKLLEELGMPFKKEERR